MVRVRAVRAVLAAAVLVLSAGLSAYHPLHTSLTELSYDPAGRAVQVSIRAFASDLQTAVTPRGGAPPAQLSDAAAFAYVGRSFSLTAGNTRVPLRWCGMRRSGDLVWICLRGALPSGMRGLQVHNRLLFELFADQINIVQASHGGRRQSMIFTRGAGPKRIL